MTHSGALIEILIHANTVFYHFVLRFWLQQGDIHALHACAHAFQRECVFF